MAIDPVLASAASSSAMLQPSSEAGAALGALRAGDRLDAVVLAKLDAGAVRLQLLGVLLDIVAPMPLKVGDALNLTILKPGPELAISVAPIVTEDVPGQTGATSRVSEASQQDSPRAASAVSTAGAGTTNQSTPSVGEFPDVPAFPVRVELSTDGLRAMVQEAEQPLMAQPADAAGLDRARTNPAPLSAEARAAVAEMVPQAAVNQQGRAPLIANAIATLANPAGEQLPLPVRQTLLALIATAIDPRGLDGTKLRQAVESSGTFQESALLKVAGVVPADLKGRNSSPQNGSDPRQDAKALLASLGAALKASVGTKAMPAASDTAVPPPLPQRGGALAGQDAVEATISGKTPPEEAARTLLSSSEAALNRTRLLQAASLPADPRPSEPTQRADRLVEIPIALPGGHVPVISLAIGGDGRGAGAGEEQARWRMRLALDLEPAGPIHALISLRGEQAGVTLWAERPETAETFRQAIGELRDALTVADLDIETLEVRDGAPPQAAHARSGAFLDRVS